MDQARDYAIMLVMLKMSLRVSEVCSMRQSSISWSHGRHVLKLKVKGGEEETWPIPKDVKAAIDQYLKLDKKRRSDFNNNREDSFIFQPLVNYRTGEMGKGLSVRMVQNVIRK